MRWCVILCTLVLLIPIFSIQSVSAQPDIEFGDWEVGFKDGEKPAFFLFAYQAFVEVVLNS